MSKNTTATATVIENPGLEFRYIQLRAAIRLESVGMKHSSGKSARAVALRMFPSMSKRSTHAQVIERLTQAITDERNRI